MARFLFTMLPANDLGLPTRMVPIARALADRGHEVAGRVAESMRKYGGAGAAAERIEEFVSAAARG